MTTQEIKELKHRYQAEAFGSMSTSQLTAKRVKLAEDQTVAQKDYEREVKHRPSYTNQPTRTEFTLQFKAMQLNEMIVLVDHLLSERTSEAPVYDPSPATVAAKEAESPAGTVKVKILSKDFSYGLKTAKRLGGKFNASDKTWSIPVSAAELNDPGKYSLQIVNARRVDPATNYVGQASLDAENSIF